MKVYKNLQMLNDQKVDVKDDLAFYSFMIQNNKRVYENEHWYLIKNCKHDHVTAFVYHYVEHFEQLSILQLLSLQELKYKALPNKVSGYFNNPDDKSISRFHMHFPRSLTQINFNN